MLTALEPTIKLLKTADSDKLMMGEVWREMYEEHERLKVVEAENPALFDSIAEMFYSRWTYAHHPAHSLTRAQPQVQRH